MIRIQHIIKVSIVLWCLILSGCSEEVVDTDKDGIPDHEDDFPNDPAVSKDSDGDGYADAYHAGYTENDTNVSIDVFPNDPTEWRDTDGDGVGDNSDDFPYDPNLSVLLGGERKKYTLAAGGEITETMDIVEGDKCITIYWELEGDSFNKEAGDAFNMRYKSPNGWSHYYTGRTDQITIALGDNEAGQWMIRFTHGGRITTPPYGESIRVQYSIAKAR